MMVDSSYLYRMKGAEPAMLIPTKIQMTRLAYYTLFEFEQRDETQLSLSQFLVEIK